MRRYDLRLRRIVDADIAKDTRPFSPFAALLPIVLGSILWREGYALLLVASPMLLGILCESFVLWRCARQMKAAGLRVARQYERQTRYQLPPEYVDSESAELAARRRRRRRRRRRVSG